MGPESRFVGRGREEGIVNTQVDAGRPENSSEAAETPASERALVLASAAGDHDAFRELVEPLRRELHLFCYRMLGSFEDAEDVLQGALLKAWRALGRYDRRSSFRTWVYRIVTHASLDALRAPWLAVPGNHDITAYYPWERFVDPFGRWREFVAEETEPVWEDGEVQVVGLNTVARGHLTTLDWQNGRLPRAGLLRALRRLRRLPDVPYRIIVALLPFLAPENQPVVPVLEDGERALRDLAQAGARLVLSGHLHVG
jgi:RNA polymerase sigma factor (sigma-70 family)